MFVSGYPTLPSKIPPTLEMFLAFGEKQVTFSDKIHIFGAFNGYQYPSYGNEFNLGFTWNYSSSDNYNPGDINLDNGINVVDITSLIDFILENTNISNYQFNLIDINNDLNVNIVDVMTLVNIILDSWWILFIHYTFFTCVFL